MQSKREALFGVFKAFFDEALPEEVEEEEVNSEEVDIVEEVEKPTYNVFEVDVKPQITPVQSSTEIGAEYTAMLLNYPDYVTEGLYCKAKKITQPYLKRCISHFEDQWN